MGEKNDILHFRLFCLFMGGAVIPLIWITVNYSSSISIFIFPPLMAGFGFQVFPLLMRFVLIDKEGITKANKKEVILHTILIFYIVILVLIIIISTILAIGLFKITLIYFFLSLFIIFFGIDKTITQRNKKKGYLKIYKIWVMLESFTSVSLGCILLVMTLQGFNDLLLLNYICLGLTACTNILLATTGVKSIK
ncbi:MAG: hypothetical protein ACFFBH_12645 [Promethearchaeota archaeon]